MTPLQDLTARIQCELDRPYCWDEDLGLPCREATIALHILHDLVAYLRLTNA